MVYTEKFEELIHAAKQGYVVKYIQGTNSVLCNTGFHNKIKVCSSSYKTTHKKMTKSTIHTFIICIHYIPTVYIHINLNTQEIIWVWLDVKKEQQVSNNNKTGIYWLKVWHMRYTVHQLLTNLSIKHYWCKIKSLPPFSLQDTCALLALNTVCMSSATT